METLISNRATHTPGPWAIGELSDGENTHVCIAEDRKLKGGGKGPAVCLVSGVSTFNEEDAANALLIAAAPDMLEALKKASACFSIPDHTMRLIRDAIAKAEGRAL